MAKVFQIKRGTTLKINFLPGAGTAGWHLTNWIPGVPVGGKTVQETFTAQIKQTTHDLLATELQKLDDVIAWVDTYRYDETYETPSWLHASMDVETGERRAWIRSISYEPVTDPLAVAGYAARNSAKFRVTIERGHWERPTARELPVTAFVAGASLVYDYTISDPAHDIAGDLPARMSFFRIASPSPGAHVGRLWLGIRSANKSGTLANFQNLWECEVAGATAGTDCSAPQADGTASPGGEGNTKRTVTPGTEGWAERLRIDLVDVTSDWADNFGRFLWLLRYKLSAGSSTWEIQFRYGHAGMPDDDFVRGPIVEVDNDAWDYAEMGVMRVPLRDLQAIRVSDMAASYEATYAIQIWARRTSGAGNLELDCICPIPVDEGWLKSWAFDLSAANADYWVFGEAVKGTVCIMTYASAVSTWSYFAAYASADFRLPPGDGRMICVYASPTTHDITKNVIIGFADPQYFERWRSLRGSE